jgi:general L-amino acid transport system permease protein
MSRHTQWLRQQLFATPWQALLSLSLLAGLLPLLWGLLDWAILRAVWHASPDACNAERAGACWGMLAE